MDGARDGDVAVDTAPPVHQRSGPPAGRSRDLTKGPIGATLLAFALPTLGSNILQSLNGSINAIWVGRFLGEEALAATSNANIIMFLMFGAVFGFGMAATILVGQSFGRRDIDAARRAVGSAVGLVLGGAVVIAIVGYLFSPEILHLLATPGEAMVLADQYLRVIFLGLPAGMLLTVLMMALRGSGDAVTPLWFMALSVVLDSGLNPLLIDGIGPFPRMGIAGSAAATLIANHVSALALLGWIYRRDLSIRLRGAEWRYLLPERALAREIIAKGLPMGAQMLVMSSAGLTMVGLVNRLGVDTAAAYGVSQQLWTYIQMPALAIGAAVSSMAAQNIGGGLWDRVGSITRWGVLFNIALTGAMVLLVLLFDRSVMTLFLSDASPALPIARHIQLIASWQFILFGVTMVLFSAVRANGAVVAPLIMLIVSMYPVRLGFALGTRQWLGPDALWWSFPVGSAVNLLMAIGYYHRGGWRRGGMTVPPHPIEAQEHSQTSAEPGGRLNPSG
ncbi:putative efflux protein, MATE family [Sphingomonas gellani]|uniref:Putative efflux protein, MATE family n=1 Tax=Sphingomonas gellani TaxID=1166340 RepID=A0A1H7ZDB2_9SPHN|nr:MATE family efflux transporter [Sphingomonas gellani]SEM56306.1 putative efflux protein, MATE family [Sphingomonas gellani]